MCIFARVWMKVKNERYHEVSKVTGFDITTVDGRNPGGLSQYLQGFIHPWWLGGFLNHQRYHFSFHPCLVRPKRSLHEDMVLDCITVTLVEAIGYPSEKVPRWRFLCSFKGFSHDEWGEKSVCWCSCNLGWRWIVWLLRASWGRIRHFKFNDDLLLTLSCTLPETNIPPENR